MWCEHLPSTLVIFLLLFGQNNGCYCPQIWQPVCASDEQIYSNMCYFICARAKMPNLVPQPMTFCQQLSTSSNQQPIENEGNGNPNAPNEGNGQNPSASNPASHSPHDATAAYDPMYDSQMGMGSAAGSHFGYVPVCQWSCYKATTHTMFRICDDMNGVHYSDCDYYKAVCRAEVRGLMLRRAPCQRSSVFAGHNRRHTWLK
ncbi:uncharacterized protein LOC129591699 [Paramacrobiotus metropolitanus]|uniref:uncharacterized protein LOC129591699 n=1 Tax=Paramacrobiotus metropolitanus TaxID=2943436 RepID=UPI0024461780|nr:uncharacterized protein LOC129591699 [Paramacrobiotus metropolitanus]